MPLESGRTALPDDEKLLFTVHPSLNLIEVRPRGTVHVQDVLAHGEILRERGLITPGMVEYVDMSELDELTVDYQSAQALVQMRQLWLELGWLGSVYYAPTELEYGIVRMVGALVSSIAPGHRIPMVPLREATPLSEVRAVLEAVAAG